MHATMMNVPLSLNHLLDRAGHLFPDNPVVSRLPDKTLRTHNYAQIHRRTRALAKQHQCGSGGGGHQRATIINIVIHERWPILHRALVKEVPR